MFKIPVKKGRVFTDRDTKSSTPVVVVNEALAREAFKNEDPIGKRLIIGRGVMREFADEPEREIIGVVGDVRDNGLNQDPGPKMYIPQPQVPDAVNALNVRITPVAWVVRTEGAAAVGQRAGAGGAAPGRPACRSRTSARWTRSSPDRPRASASTCC